MDKHGSPYLRHQSGAVLVIALIFLMIMTLVAVTAMQSTVTDQRITTNIAYKTKSLENSESPRPKAAAVMDAHTFERGWEGILGSTGTAIEECVGLHVVSATKDLYLKNDAGEDPFPAPPLLTKDMTYARAIGSETIASDLYVYRNAAYAMPGHSAAMISGYEGVGKAMAGAGAAIFFDIRSRGTSASNACTVTSADVRIMVRN